MVAGLLMAVMSLSACSANGSDDSSAVVDEDGVAAPEAVDQAAAGAGGDAGGEADAGDAAAAPGDVAAPGLPAAAPSGRRVVTVDLGVRTEDVDAAASEVRDLAGQENGFVADETSTGGDDPSARITVRVPLERTDAVVDALSALGEETSRTSSARDVEASLVDLESRVETAQAAIDRLRALIADTSDLSDVILLEGELSRREADLESLDAQRAALAGQAALATITVSLSQTPQEETDDPDDGGNPFTDGLSGGWDALKGITSVVLIVLGALLPFLIVAAVVTAVVVLIIRAISRRRPARSGGPTAPADSSPADSTS